MRVRRVEMQNGDGQKKKEKTREGQERNLEIKPGRKLLRIRRGTRTEIRRKRDKYRGDEA